MQPAIDPSLMPFDTKEEKIIPLSLSLDSLLQQHVQSLRKTVERVFGKELFAEEELLKKLPLVKWENTTNKVPGAFFIYLLAPINRSGEIQLFFQEMVSHWLVGGGDQLQIISSKNFTFHLKEKEGRGLFFVEFLVHVETERQFAAINRNLPGLADEIKLGSLSKGYAKHILEMKRLSLGGKTSYIYETIVGAMRRYPKRFEHDIFREIQRFLVNYREEFRQIRDMRHLCRIISAHYLFHKALQQDVKAYPERRQVYFKLHKTALQYTFGLKKVLGICIALNSIREYECFEERHILKAVQRILPDVRVIVDSFYSQRHEENKVLTVYIEFEKIDGNDFTLQELILLRKKLSFELKNSIEYLSPSLFIPRNEEELYRNIISLSQELKYVHDLPQAIISFQEQNYDVLKFNIILLRILHPSSLSLQELSHKLPPDERIIIERVTPVGTIRKKYPKEANVFSLEIESSHFLRKNHSVDLLKARQYIVKTIEKLVGDFRDYNGGFLLKQNQQLEAIKDELGEEGKPHELHIENLFYSLSPSIMQTLVPPKAGKALFSLFLKSIEEPLSNQQGYIFKNEIEPDFFAAIIKVKEIEIKESLASAAKEMAIEALKYATAYLEIDGHHYFCFLYLNPPAAHSQDLLNILQTRLELWVQKQLNRQIVHLHLPRATQSLDPRIGGDRTSGVVIKMLYEGLMRIDKDGKPECAIAENVDISNDGLTYTFKLKKTFWSNELPLTAYDFEYAWKKILDPNFHSLYSFLLSVIKNAESAKKGEVPLKEVGISALDASTLEVKLDYPAPHFLALTAHWTYSPLCFEIDQRHPGWAYHSADSHVSNGPFKLHDWKLNDDLEVVKNDLYWDASSVKLGKIQVGIVEDDSIALEMFKRGELDWFGDPITKIPLKDLRELKERGLVQDELSAIFWLQLNVNLVPFNNAKIRKALAYAIDRKYIIEKVLERNDEPALGFSRPSMQKIPDGALELAQNLFAEGLKELGIERSKCPHIIFSHSENDEHEAITHEIGRQWEKAFGIKINYERLNWNEYFEAIHRHELMVGGLNWYSRYDDPMYYLDLLICRDQTTSVTHWKNNHFIDLMEKAKKASDHLERNQYIYEAEKIAVDEMPLIPILFDKWRFMKNPRLKGIKLSSIGQIDFREAYLETN